MHLPHEPTSGTRERVARCGKQLKYFPLSLESGAAQWKIARKSGTHVPGGSDEAA